MRSCAGSAAVLHASLLRTSPARGCAAPACRHAVPQGGLEYVLDLAQPPHLFVIRKQHRKGADAAPGALSPLAFYYVLDKCVGTPASHQCRMRGARERGHAHTRMPGRTAHLGARPTTSGASARLAVCALLCAPSARLAVCALLHAGSSTRRPRCTLCCPAASGAVLGACTKALQSCRWGTRVRQELCTGTVVWRVI